MLGADTSLQLLDIFDFTSLPLSLQSRILSLLDVDDLISALQCSRAMRDLCVDDCIWRMHAHTYPEDTLDISVYGSYKSMVLHGNKRNVEECVDLVGRSCRWDQLPMFPPGLYYECKVLSIEVSSVPADSHIRVYFDARGETDLRFPTTSSLAVVTVGPPRSGTGGVTGGRGDAGPQEEAQRRNDVIKEVHVSLRPDRDLLGHFPWGHHKGCLQWSGAAYRQLMTALDAEPTPRLELGETSHVAQDNGARLPNCGVPGLAGGVAQAAWRHLQTAAAAVGLGQSSTTVPAGSTSGGTSGGTTGRTAGSSMSVGGTGGGTSIAQEGRVQPPAAQERLPDREEQVQRRVLAFVYADEFEGPGRIGDYSYVVLFDPRNLLASSGRGASERGSGSNDDGGGGGDAGGSCDGGRPRAFPRASSCSCFQDAWRAARTFKPKGATAAALFAEDDAAERSRWADLPDRVVARGQSWWIPHSQPAAADWVERTPTLPTHAWAHPVLGEHAYEYLLAPAPAHGDSDLDEDEDG